VTGYKKTAHIEGILKVDFLMQCCTFREKKFFKYQYLLYILHHTSYPVRILLH